MRQQCQFLLAAVLLTGCSDAEGDWHRTKVPSRLVDEIQGSRAISAPEPRDTLREIRTLKLPDSLKAFFHLTYPVMVAAGAANRCTIAVGDLADRAVHLFRSDGAYLQTFFGGGRENPTFANSTLSSVAAAGDHFLASTVMGRVVTFGSGANSTAIGDLNAPTDSSRASTHLVIEGPDGLLYDHWFHGNLLIVRQNDWAHDSSLVRVYDRRYKLVRRLGSVSRYPGEGLTHLLNRGDIAIYAETLWFARRADARILAFPLNGPYDRPSRIVELPVFFRAEAPIEDVSSDGDKVGVRIQEHLRAFAISPDGDFYVIQNVSWPHIAQQDTPFVPQSVINVYGRDGILKRTLRGPNNVLEIAALADVIVGIVGANGHLSAVEFAKPFEEPNQEGKCPHPRES
jgi:hypothetical protein